MDDKDFWKAENSAPTNKTATVEETATGGGWWRTAAETSGLPGTDPGTAKPWWDDAALPPFGKGAEAHPEAWLGVAMLKRAMGGGPALHSARFGGNCTVPPRALVETLTSVMKLRPVRYGYGRTGVDEILFSSDENMLSLSLHDAGRYASVHIASTNQEVFSKVAKLCHGLLTQDSPKKEGFVYALAKGAMGEYHLTRIGAAGAPLERGNYDDKVLASYDHVVTDLCAESPCGRLIVLAGAPGGGKTYLVRSLLADVPKSAFVVVPPHLVKELGSPELLPALMHAKHDGLSGPISLVIEDADKVLVERAAGDMAAISSLLNLGDGILGSVLDVRLICTTNAHKLEMDPATRRKGRLCQYIDVGMLEPDRAESIIRRLTGRDRRPGKKVALAEVYAEARELGWKPPAKIPPANPWEKSYALDQPTMQLAI